MATDKKGVTAYLDKELEQKLTEYCTNNGLVQHYKKDNKDKPQLGTAIVAILKQYFKQDQSVTSPLPDNVPVNDQVSDQVNDQDNDELQALKRQLNQLQEQLQQQEKQLEQQQKQTEALTVGYVKTNQWLWNESRDLRSQLEDKLTSEQLEQKLEPIWEALNHSEDNYDSLRSQLEDKVSFQQLDERLAMATQPIWEELNQTEDNFYSLRSQIDDQPAKSTQRPAKAKPQEPSQEDENKLLDLADNTEYWKSVFYQTHSDIANAISKALIEAGLKPNDYKLTNDQIGRWLKGKSRPQNKNSKHYLASQLFDLVKPLT